MKEFCLEEAVKATGGKYFGPEQALHEPVRGVVIDNRKAQSGYLFVPIKGERFDGHDFIEGAYENGALCCVSEKKLDTGKPYILVESSLDAFQSIAAFYKSLLSVKTIGITGSAGKTTTKEMIAGVLEKKYDVLKSEGNLNNQTGVPLTLLRLEEHHQIAVIEMGTNHFGEIRALSKIARPDDCFLTNIGSAHIEHLGSREGILKAKCEMLDYMDADGRVVINGDDEYLRTVKDSGKKVISYGLQQENDIYATDIKEHGLTGTDFKVHYGGAVCDVHVPAPGKYMVVNALAAFAAGLSYGMDVNDIKKGIASYAPVGDRMRTIQANGIIVLSDVYNANPHSMRAALDVLALADGRSVCILGDMLELGEKAQQYHYEMGEYAKEKKIDLVIGVGKLAREICNGAGEDAQWFGTQEELIAALPALIQAGDTVLVKGSRGMKLEQTVEALVKEG